MIILHKNSESGKFKLSSYSVIALGSYITARLNGKRIVLVLDHPRRLIYLHAKTRLLGSTFTYNSCVQRGCKERLRATMPHKSVILGVLLSFELALITAFAL